MKKIIISLCVASLFLAGSVTAQTMMGYKNNTVASSVDANIATALQDIYTSQNITSQNQIDCLKVSPEQFEKLGDAYMGYGISEAEHTIMENMMGGEGSATLKEAHINMGRGYIGCWSNYASAVPSMSMMGGIFSRPANNVLVSPTEWNPMMEGYYNFSTFRITESVTMVLIWILLILAIAALVKFIRRKDYQK